MIAYRIVKKALIIIMTIGFILMFHLNITGISFHEIGGLVVLTLFLFHMGTYLRWVISITTRLFQKRLRMRTRINYIVDMLLLACVFFIGTSGVLMSRVLFPSISSFSMVYRNMHRVSAFVILILSGVHLALHMKLIISKLKSMIKTFVK